ncbi:MAG: arsenic resistance N-acetyltransferase ArsN2 [Candidatus Thorarchaeota archaeon]
MIEILQASSASISDITGLLKELDLVIEGVEQNIDDFRILVEKNTLIGCIGLEIYGSMALLRSIAVHPAYQKKGYGQMLLQDIERYALQKGVDELFLLTDTAERFFKKYGYSLHDRSKVPPSIAATQEFSNLCPASSSFMRKELK